MTSIPHSIEKEQETTHPLFVEKIASYIHSKPDERFKYFPEMYKEKAEASLQEHFSTKDILSQKVLSLGYADFEAVLSTDIDPQNQSKSSEIIALQHSVREFLKKDQQIEEMSNAIFVEPSKIHLTVNIAEEILQDKSCGIYQRAGRIVRVIKSCLVQKPKTSAKDNPIKRHTDATIICEVDQVYLAELLNEKRLWIKLDGRSKELKSIDCPERVARNLIARREWDLPVLTGVINAPTLRSDGSILDTPGYDDETGLLFISNGVNFGKVPSHPTRDDAMAALDKFLDILKDFSYEGDDETHQSVVLSAILTGLIRKSIATAPLHGLSAPKMASGKSLLADVIAIIGSGNECTMVSHADNETEERKRLMALLVEADPFICFDNIETPFGSSALCTILTQQKYKDRLLGETRTCEALTNLCFLATGNNLTFIGDLSTRALLCKLDPKIERPEERSFDVDLRQYTKQERASLVRAGLTILRAYHIAGRPDQKIKQFGRFEEWSDWVRSAIVWLDRPDPCKSRKDIENADPVRIQLGNLLSAWYVIFGDGSFRSKEVVRRVENQKPDDPDAESLEILRDALIEMAPDRTGGGVNERTLGNKLSQFKGRIEQGYRLDLAGTYQGVALWKVKKV